jgi:hypothetical protein
MPIKLCALALALLLPCASTPTAGAQAPDDRGEAVSDRPEYQGVTANAPIPPEMHIRNEGGLPEPGNPQGAGLCVISAILSNGMYQRVPGLEGGKDSLLWRTAKSRPGGYYPGKLEALLKEVLPGEEWFSWEGQGTDLIAEYSAQGYPVAATTNTGALYGYKSIHHMIQAAHLDSRWACIVDNNDPGKYHWMPRAEFDRRFVDGEQGWGVVWLRKPKVFAFALSAAAVLLVASAVLVHHGASTSRAV